MDTIQDLELHPKDGDEERGRTRDLRQIPFTIRQKEQPISFPSGYQRTAEPENNEDGGWNGHNDHNHPMRRHCLSLLNQFPVKEHDISETGGFPSSSPPSDCGVVDHTESRSRFSISSECDLESMRGKDCQRSFWSDDHSSQETAKEAPRPNSTTEQQSSFPPGEWECDSVPRKLGSWELRGSKPLDPAIPMEARPSTHISNNIDKAKSSKTTLQELPRVSEVVEQPKVSEMIEKLKSDRLGFHPTKNKSLLDPYTIKDLEEMFGITGVDPIFVDHSGLVVWMLDDRGIMFQWSEMERSVEYLGNNLREGLANYLYHPQNICAVENGELVPMEEIERQLKELMEMPFEPEEMWHRSAEKSVNQSAKKRHRRLKKKRKSNFF